MRLRGRFSRRSSISKILHRLPGTRGRSRLSQGASRLARGRRGWPVGGELRKLVGRHDDVWHDSPGAIALLSIEPAEEECQGVGSGDRVAAAALRRRGGGLAAHDPAAGDRLQDVAAEGRVQGRAARPGVPAIDGAAERGHARVRGVPGGVPRGLGALSEETLHGVAKAAKGSLAQRSPSASASRARTTSAVSMEGIKFLKTKLSELGSGAGGGAGGGGQKEGVGSLPAELVHALLFFLDRSDGFAPARRVGQAAAGGAPRGEVPARAAPAAVDGRPRDGRPRLPPLLREGARPRAAARRADGGGARARRRARLVDGRPRVLVLRDCKVLRRGPRAVRGARRGRGRAAVAMMARTAVSVPARPARPRCPRSRGCRAPPFSPHAPPPRPLSTPRRPLTPSPPLPPRSSTTRSRCTAPSRPPSPSAISSSTRSLMPTARETRSRRAPPRPPRAPPPPRPPTPRPPPAASPPSPPAPTPLPTPQALTSWNVDAFVDAIASRSLLDWASVVTDHLDQPDLDAAPAEGLALIVAVYRKATRQPLPSSALLGEWRHAGSQLALLTHALGGGADVAWDGGRAIANPPEGSLKPELACWLNLDLTAALLRLSSKGHASACQLLFNEPAQAVPRLMLVALLQARAWGHAPHLIAPGTPLLPRPSPLLPLPALLPPHLPLPSPQMAPAGSPSETLHDLLEQLFPMFLASDAPGSTALLTRLWELQPAAVVRAMALLHQSQPQSLLRILDLCKELGALETILAAHAASRFALDLATVAQRKELINLEEWLKKCIKVSIPTNAFVKACNDYLREKILKKQKASDASVNVLSVEASAIFFRCLHGADGLPAALTEEISQLYIACVQVKPKLHALYNALGGGDPSPPAASAPAPSPAPAPAPAPAEDARRWRRACRRRDAAGDAGRAGGAVRVGHRGGGELALPEDLLRRDVDRRRDDDAAHVPGVVGGARAASVRVHGASPDSNAAASVAGAPTAFPIFSHPTAPPPPSPPLCRCTTSSTSTATSRSIPTSRCAPPPSSSARSSSTGSSRTSRSACSCATCSRRSRSPPTRRWPSLARSPSSSSPRASSSGRSTASTSPRSRTSARSAATASPSGAPVPEVWPHLEAALSGRAPTGAMSASSSPPTSPARARPPAPAPAPSPPRAGAVAPPAPRPRRRRRRRWRCPPGCGTL